VIEFCGYLFIITAAVWGLHKWGGDPPSNPWIG